VVVRVCGVVIIVYVVVMTFVSVRIVGVVVVVDFVADVVVVVFVLIVVGDVGVAVSVVVDGRVIYGVDVDEYVVVDVVGVLLCCC